MATALADGNEYIKVICGFFSVSGSLLEAYLHIAERCMIVCLFTTAIIQTGWMDGTIMTFFATPTNLIGFLEYMAGIASY